MGGFARNNGVDVMGNYANTSMAASPVNLYYSLDGKPGKSFIPLDKILIILTMALLWAGLVEHYWVIRLILL